MSAGDGGRVRDAYEFTLVEEFQNTLFFIPWERFLKEGKLGNFFGH